MLDYLIHFYTKSLKRLDKKLFGVLLTFILLIVLSTNLNIGRLNNSDLEGQIKGAGLLSLPWLKKTEPVYDFHLQIDDILFEGKTESVTVGELLEERGIILDERDYLSPDLLTELKLGSFIKIETFKSSYKEVIEEVEIEEELVYDENLSVGFEYVDDYGSKGLRKKIIRLDFLGSEQIAEEETGVILLEAMSPKIRRIGTKSKMYLYSGEEINYSKAAYMSTSGYCSCYLCCGKNPGDYGYGITASGLPQGVGVVGVDPRYIPYGTKLYIEGYGFAVAGDTGGAIFSSHLDLGFNSHQDAVRWALRTSMVYFLKD